MDGLVNGKIRDTHFFGGRGISLHHLGSAATAAASSDSTLENDMSSAHNSIFNTFIDRDNTASASPRSGFDRLSGMHVRLSIFVLYYIFIVLY